MRTTPQDEVTVGVTSRFDDGTLAPFGDRQKVVRVLRCANGIDSNLNIATRTVFKAHRAGESARQLAMTLAFGCPRANRTPSNQIRNVLRLD